jgi:LCP family protein required for cell wall assembly
VGAKQSLARHYYAPPRRKVVSRRVAQVAFFVVLFVVAFTLARSILARIIYAGQGPMIITFTNPFGRPLTSYFGRPDITILAVGLDSGPPQRTDTIMAVHMDLNTLQTRIVSVPRDLKVEIDGHPMGKVNGAYAEGGIELAESTVSRLLGVDFNYYVVVDIPAFTELINDLGGVDINVEKRMKYTDRSQGLHIDLQPGPQHLNGEQAMGYARFRHDATGDIGRMARQQKVVMAMLDEMKRPKNYYRLPILFKRAYDAVKTDMAREQFDALKNLRDRLDDSKLKGMVLDSEPLMEQGVSYQSATQDDIRKAVEFLSDLTPPPATTETQPASGRNGAAPPRGEAKGSASGKAGGHAHRAQDATSHRGAVK